MPLPLTPLRPGPRGVGLAAALLAGFLVLQTDIGWRVSAGSDLLRTTIAQIRAYVRIGEVRPPRLHPSLEPHLVRVGAEPAAAPAAAAEPATHVLIAFNMAAHNRSTDLALALETLRAARERYDPDVVLLTEAPGDLALYEQHPAFEGLSGLYAWDRLRGVDPGLPLEAQAGSFTHTGNALLARLPVREGHVVVLPAAEESFGRGSLALRNAVIGEVGDLRVVCVHLAAHARPGGRLRQVQALLPHLDARSIAGGDWNFFQRHLSDALEPGYLALAERGFRDTLAPGERFRHRSRLRISDRMFAFTDHVFAPPGARDYEALFLEAPGSDHDLLVARIRL